MLPSKRRSSLVDHLRATYENLRATQKKMVQDEKMRALGQLAAGVAHNFNNSLSGVLGFLELAMMDRDLPASCRSNLEAGRTCAWDAAQTVRRIQNFALTGWKLLPPIFRLNDLIRQTVELTRPKWDKANLLTPRPISVFVQAEATAEVLGNPGELREVLTNLICNAVDAMPQGGALSLRSVGLPGISGKEVGLHLGRWVLGYLR